MECAVRGVMPPHVALERDADTAEGASLDGSDPEAFNGYVPREVRNGTVGLEDDAHVFGFGFGQAAEWLEANGISEVECAPEACDGFVLRLFEARPVVGRARSAHVEHLSGGGTFEPACGAGRLAWHVAAEIHVGERSCAAARSHAFDVFFFALCERGFGIFLLKQGYGKIEVKAYRVTPKA